MLITFGSVKGSPGTTTWALALAARWPHADPPPVLQELAATRPVFADLGRLDPHSPLLSYLDKADELLLVAQPVPEQLRHLRARVPMLTGRCPLVRLVLVGAGPYRPDEIATYLDLPVAAVAGRGTQPRPDLRR